MAASHDIAFRPNYAVPPGETLLEVLESLGMSQADLASRTRRPLKTINEIVKGKAGISADTAIQLERALGVPASFWSNRERQYREALARISERSRLVSYKSWLDRFPLKAMAHFKWISPSGDPARMAEQLLSFLGVASPKAWADVRDSMSPAFRKSKAFEVDSEALAVWLRKGELQARRIKCASYDPAGFRQVLLRVRGLTVTVPEEFQPKLEAWCASVGVAVAFVPELPETRVFGATRWLGPRRAMVQLSLRYKTDDHLWFTFFHESGHILLHAKKSVFVEADGSADREEKEANRFASDILISPQDLREFMRQDDLSKASIRGFAKQRGIAPGIVVGRLQHDGIIPYSHCNDLKRRFTWAAPTE
ncbi:MAG: HigA family addiction module antidote protein [Planctomycetes bacterium]|nr:HigA family addiction module antidote protein [Planctomycetota bacterium]